MEPSELFMWVWAVSATILAVFFRYHASMRGKMLVVLTIGIRHIAEGKAEVSIKDGEVLLKKVEGKNVTAN